MLSPLPSRFGSLLVQFHPNLLEALQPQLKSPRLAVRKRTIVALSHLVLTCDHALYVKILDGLFLELQNCAGHTAGNAAVSLNARTHIQVSIN